jgi:hypothetical protein
MTTIESLTKQNYEKNYKLPNKFVFYNNEKELITIINTHIAKNLKESIEISEKFLSLPANSEVYEVEMESNFLYIIKK